jgi:hypothetical protein
MAKLRRAAGSVTPAHDMQAVPTGAGNRRRVRARLDLTSDSPAARIQRLLVLADRFRSSAVPSSDPIRLADLLRNIISLTRNVFGDDFSSAWNARAVVRLTPDQLRCVRDLERLLQGLAHDSPEARRGLNHAMDALLIQCVLLHASAGEEAALTES